MILSRERQHDAGGDFYLIPTTVNPVTGELVMSRLERAAEPKQITDGVGISDTIDGEIVDELDELLRRERRLIPRARAEAESRRAAAEIAALKIRREGLIKDEREALDQARELRTQASDADHRAAHAREQLVMVNARLESCDKP